MDKGAIRVASIVPFLVMKGMALADRLKEKDAYDIVFCVGKLKSVFALVPVIVT